MLICSTTFVKAMNGVDSYVDIAFHFSV